ncbi:MAG TPA: hypothetical protein VGR26_02390 [Acidimicrobiales bacterium]|nr:hypothetical protein [Acidimicrobiales bacterium]
METEAADDLRRTSARQLVSIIPFPPHHRHRQAIDMVLSLQPSVLLNCGAGDGYVVAQLLTHDIPWLRRVILYEPMPDIRADLEAALEKWISAGRVEIIKHREELGAIAVDLVLCMGVLEHPPLAERVASYELCADKLKSAGHCIIDVPLEVGPTGIAKESARVVLKGRTRQYSLKALAKTALGAKVRHHAQSDPLNVTTFIHYHTGFDYRLLHVELADRSDVRIPYRLLSRRLHACMGNKEIFFVLQDRDLGRFPSRPLPS